MTSSMKTTVKINKVHTRMQWTHCYETEFNTKKIIVIRKLCIKIIKKKATSNPTKNFAWIQHGQRENETVYRHRET